MGRDPHEGDGPRAVIIKGGPRGKGRELAAHLMRADTNERVKIFDTRGVFSQSVRGALAEMEAVAAGSKAKRPLYHVSINPEADESLTAAQWTIAADRLEKALGMEGHQRVMVQHLKNGRTHMHIAWCRVDAETMKAAHHSHNYRTHEEVARSLEREFGLKRTQGVHAEREGEKPKEKRPNTHESQQEARTGWKKADAQAAILAAWTNDGDGAGFRHLLEVEGYRLAQGDSRDYVIVDPAGGPHSIRSGVKGLRVAQIRERFADLDGVALPSVAEARKAALEAYPAFLEARRQATPQSEPTPDSKPGPKAVTFSYRPTAPKPGRYEVLRAPPTSPQPSPVMPTAKPPQPVPTPPSWAREAAPAATPPRPNKAGPPVAPERAAEVPLPKAMQELNARQEKEWLETLARIGQIHAKAFGSLEDHHQKRLMTINTDVDARLKELNGLSSRAGALFSPAERDREIAYLVAKRQRSLADEKARQEQVKDDLRRAHAREIEDAKGKHHRLAEMQRRVLIAKTGHEVGHPRLPQTNKPFQDRDREP